MISRFIEEAEVTAQLQHLVITPIHDRGVLPDGRSGSRCVRSMGGATRPSVTTIVRRGARSKTSSKSPASDRGASPGLCGGRACPRAGVCIETSSPKTSWWARVVKSWWWTGPARVGRSDSDGAVEASVDSTRPPGRLSHPDGTGGGHANTPPSRPKVRSTRLVRRATGPPG